MEKNCQPYFFFLAPVPFRFVFVLVMTKSPIFSQQPKALLNKHRKLGLVKPVDPSRQKM